VTAYAFPTAVHTCTGRREPLLSFETCELRAIFSAFRRCTANIIVIVCLPLEIIGKHSVSGSEGLESLGEGGRLGLQHSSQQYRVISLKRYIRQLFSF